jgi:putative transposase
MELRERAVRFVEAGQSRHAVARRLGVSAASVIRWLDRFTRTGSAAPGKIGGHRPPKIQSLDRDWLLERIAAGDFTIQGLTDELEAQRGLKVDYRTMWTFVHRQGLSFKKCMARPAARGFICMSLPVCTNVSGLGHDPCQDGVTRGLILIKRSAASAIFLIRMSGRQLTVRPSPCHHSRTSQADCAREALPA